MRDEAVLADARDDAARCFGIAAQQEAGGDAQLAAAVQLEPSIWQREQKKREERRDHRTPRASARSGGDGGGGGDGDGGGGKSVRISASFEARRR